MAIDQNKPKIAIVGGGIAGLTSAYLLHQKYEITLFEKDGRVGGNAYTHTTEDGEDIDMAVASYSKLVSENFLKLCSKLNVKMTINPKDALLTIHNMETNTGYYLTPMNFKGLWSQKFGLFGPRSVKDMYKAVVGMAKAAHKYDKGELAGLTVQEALAQIEELRGDRIVLMMAPLCLLSSMYWEEVMEAPAEYFMAKQKAFGFFSPVKQMWGLYFPKNFTRSYVEALASHYPDSIQVNAKIKSIARQNKTVTLKMADGTESVFDHVVFACNADQALALLEEPTQQEQNVLGPWRYKEGLMVVHKDMTYFPKREHCQSWTCLQNTRNGNPHFSITICGWRLCPGASRKSEWMATQHPNFPIPEEGIDFQKRFRTPIYDFQSFATIKALPSLNGVNNTYYCGSHFGWGLHDDAVSSAVEVAKMLGVDWDEPE